MEISRVPSRPDRVNQAAARKLEYRYRAVARRFGNFGLRNDAAPASSAFAVGLVCVQKGSARPINLAQC